MSFSDEIGQFIAHVEQRGSMVVRRLAMEGYVLVTKFSPVDTGRFRGNWNVAVNFTDMGTSWVPPARSKGTHGGAASTAAEIAYATSVIDKAKWGDTIIISNNLPYALPLEYGYSRQAPGSQAILGRAFLEVIANFQSFIATLPP